MGEGEGEAAEEQTSVARRRCVAVQSCTSPREELRVPARQGAHGVKGW